MQKIKSRRWNTFTLRIFEEVYILIEKYGARNSLFQFTALKEMVDKWNYKVQYYMNHTSKLLESNGNIEADCEKLTLNLSDIDAKIANDTKIRLMKKQELKNCQSARTEELNKQWWIILRRNKYTIQIIANERRNYWISSLLKIVINIICTVKQFSFCFRDDCLVEIGKYSNDFSQWITTYVWFLIIKSLWINYSISCECVFVKIYYL